MTDPAVRMNIKSQTRRRPVTRQLRNVAVVEAVPVAGDTVAVDNNQERVFIFSFIFKTIEISKGTY